MNKNKFNEMIERIDNVLKEYGIDEYELETGKSLGDGETVVFANIKIDIK